LAAVSRVDDEVVEHGSRAAKRHVIGAFHAAEYITNHRSVALGDEHELARLTDLRREEAPVRLGHAGPRPEKAVGIEIMMLDDEQRAKPAEHFLVTGNRWAYACWQGHKSILQPAGRSATALAEGGAAANA
jgi:hypothetical protein